MHFHLESRAELRPGETPGDIKPSAVINFLRSEIFPHLDNPFDATQAYPLFIHFSFEWTVLCDTPNNIGYQCKVTGCQIWEMN